MIKKSLFVILSVVGLSSCLKDSVESQTSKLNKEQEAIIDAYLVTNNLTAKKEALYSTSGDYFPVYTMVETKGDTVTAYSNNEAFRVAYTIKTLDNRVIETKTAADSILIYQGGYSGKIQALSIAAGYGFIGVGGKGKFIVPSTLGYGGTPPGGVEANAILQLEVEVLERLNETKQIELYIKKNKLNVTERLSSGVVIAKTKTTTDSLITGTTATVKFQGHFVNGFEFQPSATSANAILAGYIPGFAEAVKKMRKGETAIALLPSSAAYGQYGSSNGIPSYMPLVFSLELLDNK